MIAVLCIWILCNDEGKDIFRRHEMRVRKLLPLSLLFCSAHPGRSWDGGERRVCLEFSSHNVPTF